MMNFYNNLSDDGVLFFWVVVILLVILNGIAIILYIKNKKLMSLLDKKEENNEISDDTKIVIVEDNNIDKQENMEVKEIKEETADKEIESKEELENVKVEIEEDNKEPEEVKQEMDISTPRALKSFHDGVKEIEASKKMPISPIHVDRSESSDEVSVYTTQNIDEDIDDDFPVIGDSDSVSPLEDMDDKYETNDNMRFAKEIVEKMEDEIKPSNIELTDYEKKQEEEAIISYDELQKVKDKIYNITEDEETDEFIDELKSLRDDLE